MPFANLKVPAGTLTAESKKKLQDTVTDAYLAVYGEKARPGVIVIVEEVTENGYMRGGVVYNEELLGRH